MKRIVNINGKTKEEVLISKLEIENRDLKRKITELNQALQLQQTGVKRCFSDDHIGIIARNIAKEYAFENQYIYNQFEEAITKGMKIGRKVIQQNNA